MIAKKSLTHFNIMNKKQSPLPQNLLLEAYRFTDIDVGLLACNVIWTCR
jgi:hypothetical protein